MERLVDAVIFDLDGTLTDTEKYYQIAWPEAIRHFGFEPPEGFALELRSLGRPFAPKFFAKQFGESFDYNKVREYRKGLVSKLMEEHGIPLKPGALEFLGWLKTEGITVAMATANDTKRTRDYLDKIGIEKYFDRIICSDMVKFGKPAPDIYAHAVKELGLPADRVFAVEDSPNGVKSAYGAGCKVIMVPDLTEPDEELRKLLYARVDSLTDIKKLIEKP